MMMINKGGFVNNGRCWGLLLAYPMGVHCMVIRGGRQEIMGYGLSGINRREV